MMKLTLPALCSLLLLTGCASVPQTEISFDRASGALKIASPKNVEAEAIEYERTKNGAKLKIGRIVSKNDPEVLGVIANANAQTLDKSMLLMQKLVESGINGAAKSFMPVPLSPSATIPGMVPSEAPLSITPE